MRNSKRIPPSNKWTDAEDFRSGVAHWAKQVRVEPKRVVLQPMRKKWASSSNKGLVTFNSQLLDEKRDFGEYVIIHELLHLKVPNHGKLFKSLMTIYMPDWKKRAEKATDDSSKNFRKRANSPQTQTFKALPNK
jgi:predicted metal-dependent hydrolase